MIHAEDRDLINFPFDDFRYNATNSAINGIETTKSELYESAALTLP